MFKPLLKPFVMALAFVASMVSAQTVDLKSSHPVEYVVQEGDTLWDISQKFLEDAWLWPEIWQVNEQINNPHLIYPGDVIGLVYIGEQVKVTIKKRLIALGPVILSPETRISAITNAIPSIPISAISSFMKDSH